MSKDYAPQIAASGKRSGKFRHVYGEPPKQKFWFKDLKNPLTVGEGSYLDANHKFFAVAKSSGGGPVYIHRLDKPGRFSPTEPVLAVHKGRTLDMKFHPFISNMIATTSEDCSVAISKFPEDGLIENINKPLIVMKGHGKKVALCAFNPSANAILASGSFDRTVKIWNIETQGCVHTFSGMKDNIYSLEWNLDGSSLLVTSKDKNLYLFDPRVEEKTSSTSSFGGAKSNKSFWLPNLGWVGAVGFTKQAKRCVKFWDLKDMSKPIFEQNIDAASSVLMPYYDNDSGLLFMFGKGDGQVSWSEIINDNKKSYPLGSYRSTEPQKGGWFVPKKGLDVWKCEITRFLKLTKNSVIPVPIMVPRKVGGEVFQEDIYPPAYSGKPALSADEWLKGENKPPVTMSLNPKDRKSENENETQFVQKKTYQELEEENKKLKARIEELEKKLGIEKPKEEQNKEEQNKEEAKDENN